MSDFTDLWVQNGKVHYCIDFFMNSDDALALRFELEED